METLEKLCSRLMNGAGRYAPASCSQDKVLENDLQLYCCVHHVSACDARAIVVAIVQEEQEKTLRKHCLTGYSRPRPNRLISSLED